MTAKILKILFPFQGSARKNLKAFSLAAALNDTGEEMFSPYLAYFAKAFLGATPFQYGIIETFSEATNRILRIFSGALSDKIGRKKPVLWGYILIVFSRIGLVFSFFWYHLIPWRMLRQVGRALRNPAREAAIADCVPLELRGKAYGLLEMVDTIGAVLGPLLGYVILSFLTFGGLTLTNKNFSIFSFRYLFLCATVPTILSALIIFLSLEETLKKENFKKKPSFLLNLKDFFASKALVMISIANAFMAVGAVAPPMLQYYIYSLEGSSVLMGGLAFIIYVFFHFLTAYPAGIVVDQLGRKRSMLLTDLLIIVTLLGLTFFQSIWIVMLFFALYGIFESLWISSRRTAIASLANEESRAQTLGTFSTIYGLASLFSPLFFGGLWQVFGFQVAFLSCTFLCIVSFAILMMGI